MRGQGRCSQGSKRPATDRGTVPFHREKRPGPALAAGLGRITRTPTPFSSSPRARAKAKQMKLTGDRQRALPAELPQRCWRRRHRGLTSTRSPFLPPRRPRPCRTALSPTPRPPVAAPSRPARRGGRAASHVCLRISPGEGGKEAGGGGAAGAGR